MHPRVFLHAMVHKTMVACVLAGLAAPLAIAQTVAQTPAQSAAHAEGLAAGQAATPAIRDAITTPSASSVVPGYTTAPPERSYHGQPRLTEPAQARLAACALAPEDPVCQALLGAQSSANTPRDPISPHDTDILGASRIAANASLVLENMASFYSGCQVDTTATPTTETRVCLQRSDGTTAQSCARTLSVDVTRTSSCEPGEWFGEETAGDVALAVQCKPDLPSTRQRLRVRDGGLDPAFLDVDADAGWVFPQIVAPLPTPAWPPGGTHGVWIVDNHCTGNACQLTGFVAQEYRQICTGGGGESGEASCTVQRPFLPVYADCPAGTQSGDRIAYTVGSTTDASENTTWTLDETVCYAPASAPTGVFGHDTTGAMPGSHWTAAGSRPVGGYRLNPLYGPIPQMTLAFERPHTTVTETDQWSDACPTLPGDGRCTVAGALRCVNGPATRDIDGAPVHRACWRYETSLSCAFGGPTDACAPLAASGCRPQPSTCRQSNAATGRCELWETRYDCPVPPGTAVTARNCPADVFCLAGSCFSTRYTNDADFARAMSFLEAAREAGIYLDTDRLQVFRGEANRCRDRLFTNCCRSESAGAGMHNQSLFGAGSRLVFDVLMNAGNREFLHAGLRALLMSGGFSGSFTSYGLTIAINGTALPTGSAVLYAGDSLVVAFDPWSLAIAIVVYTVMAAASCDQDEAMVAMKEGAGLCHTVGTYCSSCLRILGRCVTCITYTTGKCCFNSVLARIINEQGRTQVGKGWGTGPSPDCSGFTIAELQRLDFGRMDLSEFYASIVPTLPNADAMRAGTAGRAGNCYYGEGRCP